MNKTISTIVCAALGAMLLLLAASAASAHHVLGRPSYGLNEDSNTPPAVQGEAEIGKFHVTYMVFPAFPKPNEPGRVNFYVKGGRSEAPFAGKVTFKIRDNSWFSWLSGKDHDVSLGTQSQDDSVYRQVFVFPDNGEYMISAEFEAYGEPYLVEFPLRVGTLMPLDIVLGFAFVMLVVFLVFQRRRSMTGKLRGLHSDREKA